MLAAGILAGITVLTTMAITGVVPDCGIGDIIPTIPIMDLTDGIHIGDGVAQAGMAQTTTVATGTMAGVIAAAV
jgi:hypothetical protein